MNKSIKESIREVLQALIDAGVKTSFTNKELKKFGVKENEVERTRR